MDKHLRAKRRKDWQSAQLQHVTKDLAFDLYVCHFSCEAKRMPGLHHCLSVCWKRSLLEICYIYVQPNSIHQVLFWHQVEFQMQFVRCVGNLNKKRLWSSFVHLLFQGQALYSKEYRHNQFVVWFGRKIDEIQPCPASSIEQLLGSLTF